MNDTEMQMFILGTLAVGLNLSLIAALKELRKALDGRAETEMPRIQERFIKDIKNFTPQGSVPDDVMQSAIERLIKSVEDAFARARTN